MTAKVVHLVLDTNVFMHFAWADVDWCGLAGAEEVVLVVPAVVIGELDRHRKEHRSSAMRDRTRTVISRLRTLRTSTGPAMIRDDVELRPWLDSPRCWGGRPELGLHMEFCLQRLPTGFRWPHAKALQAALDGRERVVAPTVGT